MPPGSPFSGAAACGVCPLATCMTIRSRPIGVNRAFLWTFIRSFSGTLNLCNLSFLDPDGTDNLWKAHIYCETILSGLFRSADHGQSWEMICAFC
jgi:hypothetical protein